MRNHSHQLFQHILIIIFCLMVISVPVYWIAFPQNNSLFSQVENRNLAQFPQLELGNFKRGAKQLFSGNLRSAFDTSFAQFLSNDFQKDFKDAAADQIPARIQFASLARWVERAQIKTTYAFLPDPAYPASLNVDYLLLHDGKQVYIQPPADYNEQLRENIDNRIDNYQNLLDLFPDVNFYIFYLERMAFAPYNPMNPYFPQADRGRSFDYFFANKPDNLSVSSMRLGGIEEHKEKFFRTDHHWNIRGAWAGYEIIYEMLKTDNPDISPMLNLEGFQQIEGLGYCGSYARRTLYPCQPDVFEYALVDLPPFITVVDREKKPYGNKKAYLNGDFSSDQFAEHYAEFFGFVNPLVEYDFDNSSDRNLLIIGGSYTQPMQEFIASHYNKTFVVDFRDYEDFSLGDFIQSNGNQDIIIIGDMPIFYRDGWQINP